MSTPVTKIPFEQIIQFTDIEGETFKVVYRSTMGKTFISRTFNRDYLDDDGLKKLDDQIAGRKHPRKSASEKQG